LRTVPLGGLFASTLTRRLAADGAVDGVNSRTQRDPIGPAGNRRVVLATNRILRVPTVGTSSIPATSTPVRPLTCGNAPRGGGSEYPLLFSWGTGVFAVGWSLDVTEPAAILVVVAGLHYVTHRAIVGRFLSQHVCDSRTFVVSTSVSE